MSEPLPRYAIDRTDRVSPSSAWRDPWRDAWRDRRFRVHLIVAVLLLAFALFWYARFLIFNESRSGMAIADPVLELIPPVDLTWITFALIYVSLLAGLVFLVRHPRRLLVAVLGYALLLAVRMAAMYVLPLDPPRGVIPLSDPFAELFGGGTVLNRDLFFSGHTSTIFLLFLTAGHRVVRFLFLGGALLVAGCLAAQHVHYSIDLLAAPFFTYGCYRASVHLTGEREGSRTSGSSY